MRVTIRPPTLRDFEAFVVAMRRSRPLHRSWINRKPATRKSFKQYFSGFAPGQHYRFLVIRRQTGGLVGVINLNDVIRGHFQNATVGYYAFLPYAGRGLMREGLKLVLKHAFQRLKLHRVEADIQPHNRRRLRW